MESKEVQLIRKCSQKMELDFTPHSLEQINKRKIDIEKVREAVAEGKMIEKQDQERDVKILFQEFTDGKPEFAVSVSATIPPRVVTVYRFYEEKWEYDPSTKIMKRRN